MSDAEIITTILVSAIYFSGHHEKAMSFMRSTGMVTHMLSKSRFNRRLHQVRELVVDLFFQLSSLIKELNISSEYSIDSFPIHTCENAWPYYLSWSQVDFNPYGAFVLYSDPSNPFMINWDNNDLRKQWNVYTEYIDRTTGVLTQLVYPPMGFGKFRDHDAPASNKYGNDFPINGYADVLLTYAEAASMAEGGPSALAVDCLNQIKRRGYGYQSSVASPVDYTETGLTVESFRNTVLLERAYEFISEGKRWKDLKRSGKAKETILAHLGKVVADKHMVWPIFQQ